MRLMQFLKDNDIYIVIQGDKNLGPCIMERELYIYKAFEEHLGNESNYKPLTEVEARGKQRGLQYIFRGWTFASKQILFATKFWNFLQFFAIFFVQFFISL